MLAAAGLLLTLFASSASSASAGVPEDFVGIASEDAFAGDVDYRNAAFAAQRSAGIGLVRQTMDWSTIEQPSGEFNFGAYDGFVGAAASHGLTVMPILFRAPEGKSRAPTNRDPSDRATYPPTSNGDFAKFAMAAARRYGPSGSFWQENPSLPTRPITVWQIWNEPNLPVYWGGKPNARDYVKLQAAGSSAIKSVDKRAEILTAGLPDSPNGVPLDRYIAQLYKAGGKQAFDVLAINGYNTTAAAATGKLKSIRKLMDQQKDKGAKMWVTEIGWADAGPKSRYTIGAAGQARQAASLLKLSAASRSKLKLRGVVYYTWKDAPPYAGFRDFFGLHTGLLNIDGVPKQALVSFSKAAAQIR